MSKKILGLVLLFSIGQLHGMGERVKSTVKSKPFKTCVALGMGSLAAHSQGKLSELGVQNILQTSADLDPVQVAKVKEVLVTKAPASFDKNLIDKIIFKQSKQVTDVSGVYAAAHATKDIKAISMSAKLPSDFAIIHELGHLDHDHLAKQVRNDMIVCAVNTYVVWHYMLNGSGKKRFLIAPLVGLASLVYKPLILNIQGYQHEQEADDFAIKALSEHKDIDGLRAGINFFEAHSKDEESIIKKTLSMRLGIPVEFSSKVQASSKNNFNRLRLLIDNHPSADFRIAKINQAIMKLDKPEIKE